MEISVCITAFNEEKNLPRLASLLAFLHKNSPIRLNFVIVDNGSSDHTARELRRIFSDDVYKLEFLEVNRLYGGGMKEAIKSSPSEVVCLLPADGQYSALDVISAISTYSESLDKTGLLMVKGCRVTRDDPMQVRVLSKIYTFLVSAFSGARIKDVNGLPKIFAKSELVPLLEGLPNDAVFDAGVCSSWISIGGNILEIPVHFANRVDGNSSWSAGKFRIGLKMFGSLYRFRFTKH